MPDHKLAQALFAPRSIALVGASGDPRKNTSRPQRFLRKHGYTGRIIPVNPGRAEIYHDFALRPAPVGPEDAMRMIEEVKGLAMIRGYRGLPRGDLAALAQAVSAVSNLAGLPGVAEAEINPLIVKTDGEGVVAVDGLIVRREN